MKKYVALFLGVILSLSIVSCGSSVVNDAKIKGATKVKEAVKTELVKAFDKNNVTVEGVDCAVEAEGHSQFIYEKVSDFLKIKKEESNVMALSAGDTFKPLLRTACEYGVEKGLPLLFERVETDAKCLKKLGEVKLKEVGSKACSKIE